MDIKKLEQRILDLERILGLTNDDKLPEMCLGESLLTTQQQFTEMNFRQDKELNSQIMRLVQFQNSSYAHQSLTTQHKSQIILANEPQLVIDVKYLNNILELSKHVDFEPVFGLKAKREDLALLQTPSKLTYHAESSQLKCESLQAGLLKTKFAKVTQDTEALLQANSEIVECINQKILFYASVENKK